MVNITSARLRPAHLSSPRRLPRARIARVHGEDPSAGMESVDAESDAEFRRVWIQAGNTAPADYRLADAAGRTSGLVSVRA